MSGFTLSREAREDLRSIRAYLKSESTTAWSLVVERLHAAMRMVSANPGIGRSRPEITRHPFRFFLVRPYLAVYNPRTDPVTIAAVLHGAQDLKRRLRTRR